MEENTRVSQQPKSSEELGISSVLAGHYDDPYLPQCMVEIAQKILHEVRPFPVTVPTYSELFSWNTRLKRIIALSDYWRARPAFLINLENGLSSKGDTTELIQKLTKILRPNLRILLGFITQCLGQCSKHLGQMPEDLKNKIINGEKHPFEEFLDLLFHHLLTEGNWRYQEIVFDRKELKELQQLLELTLEKLSAFAAFLVKFYSPGAGPSTSVRERKLVLRGGLRFNLARVLRAQGDYPKAEQLLMGSLEDYAWRVDDASDAADPESIQTPTATRVATVQLNLAFVNQNRGRPAAGYRQVLAARAILAPGDKLTLLEIEYVRSAIERETMADDLPRLQKIIRRLELTLAELCKLSGLRLRVLTLTELVRTLIRLDQALRSKRQDPERKLLLANLGGQKGSPLELANRLSADLLALANLRKAGNQRLPVTFQGSWDAHILEATPQTKVTGALLRSEYLIYHAEVIEKASVVEMDITLRQMQIKKALQLLARANNSCRRILDNEQLRFFPGLGVNALLFSIRVSLQHYHLSTRLNASNYAEQRAFLLKISNDIEKVDNLLESAFSIELSRQRSLLYLLKADLAICLRLPDLALAELKKYENNVSSNSLKWLEYLHLQVKERLHNPEGFFILKPEDVFDFVTSDVKARQTHTQLVTQLEEWLVRTAQNYIEQKAKNPSDRLIGQLLAWNRRRVQAVNRTPSLKHEKRTNNKTQ